MDQKTEEFRKKIAEMFISTLQADPLAWRKGWANSLCMPQNAVTGAKYRGINFLYLLMEAKQRGYEDLRLYPNTKRILCFRRAHRYYDQASFF